eukprot:GHVR01133941.1.p1 GENE.GHVR01133941.1~~GHVR01133941.1.p1  ORF type:complete len:212 (+),score=50.21 GHVR01133941.1:35-637(+)
MGFAEEVSGVTSIGWAEDQGKRDYMEDGWVVVDSFGGKSDSIYVAVYDGHGGRETVEFITAQLHESLLSTLKTHTPIEAFKIAFQTTDDDLKAQSENGMSGSGCTACALMTHVEDGEKVIYCAHLGDARAVLSINGVARRLTSDSDHKASDAYECEQVKSRGGIIVNDRVNGMLAITRAFGDFQFKKPKNAQDVVSCVPG